MSPNTAVNVKVYFNRSGLNPVPPRRFIRRSVSRTAKCSSRKWQEYCERVQKAGHNHRPLETCSEKEITAYLAAIGNRAKVRDVVAEARQKRKRFGARDVVSILRKAEDQLSAEGFFLCRSCTVLFRFAGRSKIKLTVKVNKEYHGFSTSINRFIVWTTKNFNELLSPDCQPVIV